MEKHIEITDHVLKSKIRKKEINLGGNQRLKIYGLLSCSSGKRMKKENRIFFISENEALENNYRPCAHGMKAYFSLTSLITNVSTQI
ncbi:metal-binding protein [Chryseobacterium shigense]|uniref:Ada metal-binding domain-containing protein n=1 Tax=Chryseobacterium shigense TaxID=297244 RepID=UPI0009702A8C|nr:Ada metal-binding domain-containing protein [Chryseobacterium shigense]PQA92055.1 metal-binding protein [Chryseobacterium shigense]